MVAVTYGVSRVRAGKTSVKTSAKTSKTSAKAADQAPPQQNFFARFFEALVESRLQQAHREIVRHAHLLPYSLDERGNRLVKVDGRDMPFGGW
jgi:hypothetical protein